MLFDLDGSKAGGQGAAGELLWICLEERVLPAKFNRVQEVREATSVGEEGHGYVVVIESAEGGVGIDVNDGDGEAKFGLGMAEGLFGDFAEVTSGAGVEVNGYHARSGREP